MYATVFDKGYMSRGIAMGQSLIDQDPSSRLTVLCLDLESEIGVTKLLPAESVLIVRPSDIGMELLRQIRENRDYREFCWTLGSLLCHFLLEQGHEEVIYLDADIFFFGDPSLPLTESRRGDVAAIMHRFPERLKKYEVNGKYNVQWVYFRNNDEGRIVSTRWAQQCVTSCAYDPDHGVVGDQKYLDEWPTICPTFVTVTHGGSGVAPWNHETYRPVFSNGRWKVATGEDLVFYHFHGLKIDENGSINLAGSIYSEVRQLPRELYMTYIDALKRVEAQVENLTDLPLPSTWRVASSTRLGRVRQVVGKVISG